MSSKTYRNPTIPHPTEKTSIGLRDFAYNSDIQKSYPLPLTSNADHTIENLRYRHAVLCELDQYDDMQKVTKAYHKCHHPDYFGWVICPDHPEAQAYARPNSCSEVLICKECARKHHAREAARWSNVIKKHAVNLRPYHKPYHVTLTTPYQLGSGNDADCVRQIMCDTTLIFRRYFKSLARVARWHYARLEYKKTGQWIEQSRYQHHSACQLRHKYYQIPSV